MRTLAFSLLLALPLGAQQRPVTSADYYAFETLSDPRVSPDGRQVAYVVTRVDRAANRRVSTVWVTSTDGAGQPRRLTSDVQNASSPRWSPDGAWISFQAMRGASDTAAAPRTPAPPSQAERTPPPNV